MSEIIISRFLTKDNINELARQLRIDAKLVQKFATKWHVLLSYETDRVLRRDGSELDLTIGQISEAVQQLNNEFLDEYEGIFVQNQTWEESNLKKTFYGAFQDQQPNRTTPTQGMMRPFPVQQRSNRASSYIGEVYDSQSTEYGYISYSQMDHPKTYTQLQTKGKLGYMDPKELYARCKIKRPY